MPKNIFEQLGDALTGADKRATEAAKKAQAEAQAAADAARAAADAAEAQAEAERQAAAEAAAKAQEEAKAASEAQYAEMQRQMELAKQRSQAEELEKLRAEVQQVKEQAAAKARTYTVKSGDSLWAIAAEVLGDGSRWPEIFEANRDKIKDANLIHPGQELTIP